MIKLQTHCCFVESTVIFLVKVPTNLYSVFAFCTKNNGSSALFYFYDENLRSFKLQIFNYVHISVLLTSLVIVSSFIIRLI